MFLFFYRCSTVIKTRACIHFRFYFLSFYQIFIVQNCTRRKSTRPSSFLRVDINSRQNNKVEHVHDNVIMQCHHLDMAFTWYTATCELEMRKALIFYLIRLDSFKKLIWSTLINVSIYIWVISNYWLKMNTKHCRELEIKNSIKTNR